MLNILQSVLHQPDFSVLGLEDLLILSVGKLEQLPTPVCNYYSSDIFYFVLTFTPSAVLYSIGALSTRSNLLPLLLLGRVAGGLGTSLLFSAPEAW